MESTDPNSRVSILDAERLDEATIEAWLAEAKGRPPQDRYRFRRLAAPWIRGLGYGVIPCEPGTKAPLSTFGWVGEMTPEMTRERLARLANQHPDADGLLCLDALDPDVPHLDVLDVDDLDDLAWVEETFGPSPLRVSSGREGGGVHLYYQRDRRRPYDERGSRNRIGKRKIDFKSHHGYVVAAGSTHRTGLVYRLWYKGRAIEASELTREMMRTLPVLDRDELDRVIAGERSTTSKAEPGDFFLEMGFGTPKPSTKPGGYPTVAASASARFRDGRYAGRAVADVAATIVDGEAVCCCPHDPEPHRTDVQGGTTAILHVTGARPTTLFCFACSVTYVYERPKPRGPDDDVPSEPLYHSIEEYRAAEEALRATVTDRESARVEARRLEAERLDPRRIAEAKEVVALAKTFVGRVRRHLRSRGWPTASRCSKSQVLYGTRSTKVVNRQLMCGRYTCLVCASWKVAVQAAAACIGSVTSKADGDDRPLAIARGAETWPTVYVVETGEVALRRMKGERLSQDAKGLLRLRDALRKTDFRFIGVYGEGGDSDKAENEPVRGAPWVAFSRGGRATVLTPVLPRGWTATATLTDPDAVRRTVLDLALATYSMEPDLDLDGLPMSEPKVRGRITSSESLHLEAEAIGKVANASEFVLLVRHAKTSPETLDAVRALGVPAAPKIDTEAKGQPVIGWVTDPLSEVALHRGVPATQLKELIRNAVEDPDGFTFDRRLHVEDLSFLDVSAVGVRVEVLDEIRAELEAT